MNLQNRNSVPNTGSRVEAPESGEEVATVIGYAGAVERMDWMMTDLSQAGDWSREGLFL